MTRGAVRAWMDRLFGRPAGAAAPWTPSAPATEEQIAWAYRTILDRDPDPGGLAHYAARARTDGMTLRRLRETLLVSTEYRRVAREHVTRVDIGGAVVMVNAEDPHFGATIARHGEWEPQLKAILARHLSPGSVFVDVGANVGVLSFRAARLVGERGKVLAFEPDPQNASLFLRGLHANAFEQVTLFPMALSDRRATFSLVGGSNANVTTPGETDVVAQAVPGDAILGQEPRIDLVKIDIEGHEPAALRGLAATLARHRPLVLAEYNPRCLRDHAGMDHAAFAAQLFALTPEVTAIEHDGRETVLRSAAALASFWEERNANAVATGFLPDGMLHLDLLFRPG